MAGVDALLVGCPSSGKTLLVRHMRAICSQKRRAIRLDTEQTTGMELDTLEYFARPYSVQESGGKMARMWSAYYKSAKMIIYVVDTTSREQLADALNHIMELQDVTMASGQPLLILLNKSDVPHRMSREDLDRLLCLRDLAEHQAPGAAVMEVSAVTGKHVELVIRWIMATKDRLQALDLEQRRAEVAKAMAEASS